MNSRLSAARALRTLSSLRRVSRPTEAMQPEPEEEERCDLCATPVGPGHRHLIEPEERRLVCACDACTILFPADANVRFKPVPRDIKRLDGFSLSDQQWESLMIPINIAFFMFSSATGKMAAFYPSPAGATESLLDLDSWTEFASGHKAIASMQPDVEALVVNRLWDPYQYFILPIDHCYRMVGLIRTKWRGLSGGDEVWADLRDFFERVGRAARA
ncbi:MAG: DUF5947 family protein [Acidobacteriota bacterium]